MLSAEHFLYFAYGSNMLSRRLCAPERAPSARIVTTGYIAGHKLTFDKLGKDGSGKCDALPTGDVSHQVYGVVYEVTRRDRVPLDAAESLGVGYDAARVQVNTERGTMSAMTYIAKLKQAALVPFRWYRDLLIAGATENGLPPEYIQRLKAIPAIEDHDCHRHATHQKLLTAD